MFSNRILRTATLLSAVVMASVGIGAAALPLKAQHQEMLCQFYFPGCTQATCQSTYCDVYYPLSTGKCQGVGGTCCNCFY